MHFIININTNLNHLKFHSKFLIVHEPGTKKVKISNMDFLLDYHLQGPNSFDGLLRLVA